MIVTDGNGNRVSGVVDLVVPTYVWRAVNGYIWQYVLSTGVLRDESGSPYFIGTQCVGTPLYETSIWGPASQEVIFGAGGQAYGFDMTASAVSVNVSDTVVRAHEGGCSAPHPLSYWTGGSGTENLWPLKPIPSPADLIGPLTVSAQE